MKEPHSTRTIIRNMQYNLGGSNSNNNTNNNKHKIKSNSNQSNTFFPSNKPMNVQYPNYQNKYSFSPKQLHQHINLTLTHFSIKCNYLINQIENMKSDFISQIESILSMTSATPKLSIQPFLTSHKHLKLSTNESSNCFPHIINYNSENISKEKQKKQNEVNQLISNRKRNQHQHGNTCNNSMVILNDNYSNVITRNNGNSTNQANTTKQVVSNIKYMKMKATNINTSIHEQCTHRNRQLNGLNYNFNTQNDVNSCKHTQHNEVAKKENKRTFQFNVNKTTSTKAKALLCMIHVFNVEYNDVLKIKYLNKELYMHCGDVKCIVNDAIKNKEQQVKDVNKESGLSKLRRMSVVNVCFVTKECEKELCNDVKGINKLFLELTCILVKYEYKKNVNCNEMYRMLLKWMKMDSIRQLYLDIVVKKMLYGIEKVDGDVMKKYVDCYDRNKDKNDFKDQNLFVLNGDMCIAMFAFIINDINEIFKYELSKRKKIAYINTEIKLLKQKQK